MQAAYGCGFKMEGERRAGAFFFPEQTVTTYTFLPVKIKYILLDVSKGLYDYVNK